MVEEREEGEENDVKGNGAGGKDESENSQKEGESERSAGPREAETLVNEPEEGGGA